MFRAAPSNRRTRVLIAFSNQKSPRQRGKRWWDCNSQSRLTNSFGVNRHAPSVFGESHASQGGLGGTRSTQRASNPEHQRYQQLCTQRHVAQATEEEMNPSLARDGTTHGARAESPSRPVYHRQRLLVLLSLDVTRPVPQRRRTQGTNLSTRNAANMTRWTAPCST